jgi:hypothetical protein
MSVTACGDISTRGATLLFSTELAGTYNEIGAITVMPDLAPTAGTDTCTDPYGVDNGGYAKEYKTGGFDGNDAGFTVKLREGDVQHDLLKSYFDGADSDSEGFLRVQLASAGATKFTFPVIVKGVTHAFPPDGGICTVALSTKVNGKIVESAT